MLSAWRFALGIDLGGTKIEIIGLDERGAVLLRRRRPSPRGSYEAPWRRSARWSPRPRRSSARAAPSGFGTPGAISPATGLLKNSNSTWLNGKPLDRDLAEILERPIAMANDADCLALSEATDGAAAGAATVFAVILGTGVGGGLAVHGKVLAGPNAIAGEWGHNPLPWPDADELPGAPCYCGLRGLHRDLAVRPRAGPRLSRARPGSSGTRRRSSPLRRSAMRRPRRRCAATSCAWRAGSPR